MIVAPSHRHHVAQVSRHSGLAGGVVSPSGHRPVALERQTVIVAPGHRHHVAQANRQSGLAMTVVSPSHNLFANSKYLVRSVRHFFKDVARHQPKMVSLIVSHGNRVCNPNNSCRFIGEYYIRISITQVRSPLEPNGRGQTIGVHHSIQHASCPRVKGGWQSRNIGDGGDDVDGICGRIRVDYPVICNELEGISASLIRASVKNHKIQ